MLHTSLRTADRRHPQVSRPRRMGADARHPLPRPSTVGSLEGTVHGHQHWRQLGVRLLPQGRRCGDGHARVLASHDQDGGGLPGVPEQDSCGLAQGPADIVPPSAASKAGVGRKVEADYD